MNRIVDQNELKIILQDFAKSLTVGDTVLLIGDLGVGKTYASSVIINALLAKPQEILSPTFNLVHTYEAEKCRIWHFDLYRLSHPDEVYELGIEDALASGITVVEWPQIAIEMMPEDSKVIKLDFVKDSPNKRQINIGTK
jgi:tRNA threonylcarbamoyladenosine biosynthesis protein TsaE